jgi:uncharacterized protein (DUF4415 family)
MPETDIVRAVLIDGKVYEQRQDGSLMPLVDQTDHARMAAMTDEEIEAEATIDPESPPMTDEEWALGELRAPVKVPVGLRLDDDIVRWFKGQGRGYQTRINSVLRRYVEAHRKSG